MTRVPLYNTFMARTPKKQSDPSPKWKRFIDKSVRDGRYRSTREAIDEAIKLLAERDVARANFAEYARNAIEEGAEAIERGEVFDGPSVMAELRRRRQAVRNRKTA